MSYKIIDERDVNQVYNAESENPQSGKAVAQALKEYVGDKLYEAPYIKVNELPRYGEIDKIYIVNDKQYIYNLKDKNVSFEEAEIWDGTTQTEPKLVNGIYEITNGAELAYVIANGGGENNVYKLTKDIYLNEEFDFNTGTLNGKNLNNWFNICWNKSFAGIIDGDGHTIYGLYYRNKNFSGANFLSNLYGGGLISKIKIGTTITIKNLGIDNAYIGDRFRVSAFVGLCGESVSTSETNAIVNIENCYVGSQVKIIGYEAGAFVGGSKFGSVNITNSYSEAIYEAPNGYGLVCSLWNSTANLSNCYNVNGPIKSVNDGGVTLSNCYETEKSIRGSAVVVSKENMTGTDVLTNPNKMPNLNSLPPIYIATEGFPKLILFACGWLAITPPIDQIYNPESINAQSGIAVREAIKTEVGEIDPYGDYGLQIVNGQLTIASAGPHDIIGNSYVKPITPSIMGYAVYRLTDQFYNPNSDMPQSGIAVKEAIEKSKQNPILDYITYEIKENNTITITGCDTSISESHIIPNNIEGYLVSTIGESAFIDCSQLKNITIPNSITKIEKNAFVGCSKLNDVYYTGTEEEWYTIIIDIDPGNEWDDALFTARIHYNQVTSTKQDIIDSIDQVYDPISRNAQSGKAVAQAIKEVDKVYIGTGTMPESYNIQINPEGSALELPVVDQTYNPESENAQSGIAVAEALETTKKQWTLLHDKTLEQAVNVFAVTTNCKEVYLEGTIIVSDENIGKATPVFVQTPQARLVMKTIPAANITDTSKTVYIRGEISIAPNGRLKGFLSGDTNKLGYSTSPIESTLSTNFANADGLIEKVSVQCATMEAGTNIKIWGVL